MKIECPKCHKVYNIPDKRLAFGKEISFPCPDCKGTIEIDLRPKFTKDDTIDPSQEKQQEDERREDSSTPSEELLSGEALKKKILKNIRDLPPMPQTVHKAREVIANPSSSFKELGKVLETDPAIAARVLKMSNSAYYGLMGQVSTIQHASVVLGHKTLGELLTIAGTSNLLGDTLEGYGLEAGDMWRHSLGVAFASKNIANRKNPGLANDAFAAGLIHDAGKLILDEHILDRKEMFEEFMVDGKQSFLVAEKEILGFDHSEIASEVCKNWNVPETLTTAIRYHHHPSLTEENTLAYIVHMADASAMMTGLGLGMDGMLYQMDENAAEFLGLKADDVSQIMVEVVESVESISEQMHKE